MRASARILVFTGKASRNDSRNSLGAHPGRLRLHRTAGRALNRDAGFAVCGYPGRFNGPTGPLPGKTPKWSPPGGSSPRHGRSPSPWPACTRSRRRGPRTRSPWTALPAHGVGLGAGGRVITGGGPSLTALPEHRFRPGRPGKDGRRGRTVPTAPSLLRQ